MKKKKLYLIMITTILVAFSITGSVAYYRYAYSGSVKVNTANVVFNVSSTSLDANTQKINLGSGLKPGSSGTINVTFDSTGSDTDMYVTFDIKRIDLPNGLNFYYNETHNGIINKYYSLLDSSKKSETLALYWYWDPNKDDENDTEYINKTISAQVSVSAVQISEYATMKHGYPGEFWSDTYKKYIRTINFGNDLSNLPSECSEGNLCWDISESSTQNKKVYGYLVDSGLTVSETDSSTNATTTRTLYNLYIVSEAPIFAPSSCNSIFSGFSNLISIDFNNNFNTSNVFNFQYMFLDCSSLIELDLSSFNTNNVEVMQGIFSGCSSLTSLDLSSFNTSNITDFIFLFDGCSSLTSLDLNVFNTSKVTRMSGMFGGCEALTSIDLSNFDTSKVTGMSMMFYYCSLLTTLDLSSFNTSNVTNMSYMFYGCGSLTTTINIMSSGVTSYDNMFMLAATNSGAKITVNYIEGASTLVDNMIATKASNSHVVKASRP